MRRYFFAAAVVLFAQPASAQDVVIPAEPLVPLEQWFHPDDYPAASMRGAEEGDVSALLAIDPQGMVTGCRVTHSSGHPLLDRATCALAVRRGRFTPAKNVQRQPVVGSYVISGVKWRINGIGAPTGGPPIVEVRPPATSPVVSSTNNTADRATMHSVSTFLGSLSAPALPATLPVTPQRIQAAMSLWDALNGEQGMRTIADLRYQNLLKQVMTVAAPLPAVMQTTARTDLHAAFEAAMVRHIALERGRMARYYAARLDDREIGTVVAFLSSGAGYKMVHDASGMTLDDRQNVGRAELDHPEVAKFVKMQLDLPGVMAADRVADTKVFYSDVNTGFCRAIAHERFVFSSCPQRKH